MKGSVIFRWDIMCLVLDLSIFNRPDICAGLSNSVLYVLHHTFFVIEKRIKNIAEWNSAA
jgi:hypothetical protein